MILVGDLGKFPLVKDKPFYAGRTTMKVCWESFNIVVTLDKIFTKEVDDPRKTYF